MQMKWDRGPTADVFNIGTGRGNSVYEVISACEAVTGREIGKRVTKRGPGDALALVADCSKLTAALGMKPVYTEIEKIVEIAWRWHKSNPDGYPD